ncbi:arginine--tRNA ligase [Cellvibrio japonicus]|uniref:Arginine--tRNA ligase n=1 Tax=Cellvibrio japonicus (strain Ueda107) TaxID=498211 RepID=SYR_CELJU|nr:arginine--tRNA ligase [Cellvibrio japonicus]B3PKE3.1 RecName: Full=Arginine--tRNA ligase; AltName: Full=Arginyl-tRNA synthetase; Short=ArgRS [Cellvibrio japonicus Ueda107]ACE83706.1 arginyl-tRNA synthetase [Cellvibrio japonicus Ueda107]QEI12812.1 arginine--tRNA ligase [Cellvibrio japonicus]QEI16386.1 arginine--tRNA ligase [Cellvibrio japonicus]QEI19964.1 arginine--tRNA ligase [Cellvibrio japonicus]
MNIRDLLNQRVLAAMATCGVPADLPALIAPGKKAGFGDYQANGAMGAAKAMGTNPRDLAGKIVAALDLEGIADKLEIAGPGFINIYLKPAWLGKQIALAQTDARLAVPQAEHAQTVVIDYSGPNLAKEMHVGHLRSTIIGDSLARLLEFLGHQVIRQNHVGDWGTQFGMLIAELEEQLGAKGDAALELKDLEVFYQQAKKHFDDDAAFADKARDYVVRLQGGDAQMLKLWQQFKDISLHHSSEIYQQLNVTLTDADVRGESFYNDDLAPLVKALQDQGLAVESEGAQVVFLPELADKDGNPSPVIIQKQGGGFLYATTDLAALRYRVNTLNAKRIMYFIDARQSLHMQQVFTISRKAGFVSDAVSLEHLAFGTMMGSDGKPFKTRTGGTVKLAELLSEAVDRAASVVSEKNPELAGEDIAEIARKVGIGAVKYADLCKTRTNDYVFSWESMLSFEGNTAPYLQYAYTRVQSIFRKAGVAPETLGSPILLGSEQEKALAIKLLQFSEVLDQMAREAMPHLLCTYLYDIASLYMSFYEACPILKEGVDAEVRDSRLRLCHLVARTIAQGLGLLGIEVMERM